MVCALGIEETLVAWLATLLRYLRNTISTSTLYHSLRFSSSCRTLDWTRKIIMNSRSYLRTICSSSKMRLVSKIADVSLLHSQLARKWTYLLLSSSLMTHLMEIQLSSVRLICLAFLSKTSHQSLSECLNQMSKRWKYPRQRLVMGAWEMLIPSLALLMSNKIGLTRRAATLLKENQRRYLYKTVLAVLTWLIKFSLKVTKFRTLCPLALQTRCDLVMMHSSSVPWTRRWWNSWRPASYPYPKSITWLRYMLFLRVSSALYSWKIITPRVGVWFSSI